MNTDAIIKEFSSEYEKTPDHIFFCPGRVNLIGEHIDYNGCRGMPCAVLQGTYLAVARNKDIRFRFQSLDLPEMADLHLQESYSRTGKQWFNYPLGIIDHFIQNGFTVSGL